MPEPEGTAGFTPPHAGNMREEMKFKSETCELKLSHKEQRGSTTGESHPE